jgi:predicted DsbA family dithiol-disulfide isomerase
MEQSPVSETAPSPLTVDIVSDVMCPWCYIGKRRFEKARALKPDMRVDVRWRPFQLDPTIPPGGIDRKQYLHNKFGGTERAQQIYASVSQAGAMEDIPFAFDKIRVSPNTLDAHRLIRWAVTPGLQDAIVERLFSLYFIEGRDVGAHDVLLAAAEEVGLDRAIIAELIGTDADADLVRQEVALAQQLGISGVPCFIVNNRYAVMGAEQPEVIVTALERAAQDASPVTSGQAPYN